MMDSVLLPFSTASFLSFLLDVSLKSLPVFALAGLGCLWLRRASAASRHALWVVTVVSLLCLPAFCVLLPHWLVPVLPASAQHYAQTSTPVGSRVEDVAPQQPLAMEQPPTAGVGKLSPPSLPATGSAPSMSSPTPSFSAPDLLPPSPAAHVMANPRLITSTTRRPAFRPTMTQLVLLIWLVGVLMVLARALVGIMAARRLVRRCQEVVIGSLADAAELARATLRLSYGVAVREGPPGTAVVVPMTFGLLRPVVLLPSGAADWPAERLRVVMLHEIAHIKRRDWLTTMLAEVACALYWFHPLVWLSSHRLRTESEQACDDLVLTSGVQAVDYADHLLEVVRGLTGRRGSMPAVVTMAHKRDVTGRIKTILATSRNRNSVTSHWVLVTAIVAACFLGPLAAMHLVASPKADGTKTDGIKTDGIKTDGRAHPPLGVQLTSSAEQNLGAIQNLGAMMSSPTHLATLMAGKSRWERRLSDGTRVRLLFVGAQNAQYNIISSWTPGGTLQQPGDAAIHPPLIYGKHDYQFVYGIIFPSAERQGTALVSYSQWGERAGISGSVPPWHRGEANWLNFPTSFPEGQRKATVLVKVATGPETTLIAAPPQRGATRILPSGEAITLTKAFVSVLPAQHQPMKATGVVVTLPSRFVRDMSEYKFYPVDHSGRPLPVQHSSSSIPDTTKKMARVVFTFRTSEMPLSRVKEFRFTYRLSQSAIFRNVALKPISRAILMAPDAPTPQASRMPAASPVDATDAPAVMNAVGGLAQVAKGVSLQLVAASDKPWDNHRWWRPDGAPFVYNPQVFRTNYTTPPRTYPQVDSALMFRLTQAEDDTTVEGWQFVPGVNSTTTGFSCLNIAKGSVRSILSGNLRKISEGPKTFGVRLRVGAGPWKQEQVRFSPAEGATTIRHSGNGWNGKYEVRRLSATATKIAVTPATQNEVEAMRVVAFDHEGREYFPGPSFSGMLLPGNPPGPRTEYPLVLPLSQIKKLVVETRPYRYVDFKGIARQPNTARQWPVARQVSLESVMDFDGFAGVFPVCPPANLILRTSPMTNGPLSPRT